jgi:hypothetical protein
VRAGGFTGTALIADALEFVRGRSEVRAAVGGAVGPGAPFTLLTADSSTPASVVAVARLAARTRRAERREVPPSMVLPSRGAVAAAPDSVTVCRLTVSPTR